MIITANELLNSGLPISDEISTATLNDAIMTAEIMIVLPRLGDSLFTDIECNPEDYDVILNGGLMTEELVIGDESDDDSSDDLAIVARFSGLKYAEYHLAFAVLLTNTVVSTTFGTVVKKDDYSDAAGAERIERLCRQHTAIGMKAIKEITDWFQIPQDEPLPNLFEELI